MTQLNLKKMHGLGNDFVILDARTTPLSLSEDQIKQICDRNFGVGCDQLIVMEPSDQADYFMRIYNIDGSEAEACGNATRCTAHLYMAEQGVEHCTTETLRGVLGSRLLDNGLVETQMGEPVLAWDQIPLSEECDPLALDIGQNDVGIDLGNATAVSMGNPHCVFFVDDLAPLLVDNNVENVGKIYEHHPRFPRKTNVEFVQQTGGNSFTQITWERGSGRTLACGSAASAVAVAAIRRGLVDDRILQVDLEGGRLQLEWRESDNIIYMTGPVAYVFDGVMDV